MANSKYITRNYNFEIRAIEENGIGIIEGRAIVFESKTDLGYFAEIIHRGALDKTNLKDVRFLVNHDTSMIPLARSRNNNENSTMQLIVDDNGMRVRIKLDIENNSEARNLYSAIKRGDISGMSFMFCVDKQHIDDADSDYPTRHIDSIEEVLEVSAVTFPAYEETEINARAKTELDSLRVLDSTSRGSTLDSECVDDKKLELLKRTYLMGGI